MLVSVIPLLAMAVGFSAVCAAAPWGRVDTPKLAVDSPPGATAPKAESWQWASAAPDELGFNSGTLEAALDKIGRMDGIYSILIVRNGYLAVERYYREGYRDKPHNLKSASKSVLSALVGIAIDEGYLRLDQPISEILPQAKKLNDSRKSDITVRHLLSMTSGLTPTSYESYSEWVLNDDWVEAALNQPLVADPGNRFEYSTADTHILSAVLTAATGMSTREFAIKKLFDPMEITIQGWAADPIGIYQGGNNLALIPRDMAKIGLLYLDGGKFEDQQILPAWWVDVSTRPGRLSTHKIYGAYGYLWYSRPGGTDSFVAVGYGGQYIYVSPAYNTVIVITSTLDSKGPNWENALFQLIHQGLLSSIEMGPRPIRREGLQIATTMNPTGQANPPGDRRGRTSTRLNLRQGPNKSDSIIKTLEAGTDLQVKEQAGPWYRVSYGSLKGWVFARYVEILPSEPVMASTAKLEGLSGVKLSFAMPGQGAPYANPPVSGGTAEVKAVQDSREALSGRLRASQKAETQLAAEITTLLDKVEEQREAVGASEAARQNLISELAAAREKIDTLNRSITKGVAKIAPGEGERHDPEQELAAVKARLGATEKTLTDSRNDRDWLTGELARVGAELETQRETVRQAQSAREALAGDLDERRAQYVNLTENLQKAETEKKAFQLSTTALLSDLAAQDDVVAQSQASQALMEKELASAGGQIKALQSAVEEAVAEGAAVRDELHRETAALTKELGALETALSEQKGESEKLTAELAKIGEDVEKQREMTRQSDAARETLTSQLAELRSENSGLMETLKTAETGRDDLAVKTASLSKDLTAQRDLVAQSLSAREAVENDLASAREEVNRLETAARAAEVEQAELRTELKGELAAVQTAFDNQKSEGERLTTELARVGEALEKQQEITRQSDSSVESLSAELAALRSQNAVLSESLRDAESARDDLDVKMASLEKELAEQREILARSNGAQRTAELELASAREEIQTLLEVRQGASAQAADALESSSQELASAKASLRKLEKSLSEGQSAKMSLTDELAQAKRELEVQKKTTAQAENRRDAVVSNLANLQGELAAMDDARQEDQAALAALKTELARQTEAAQEILEDRSRLEGELASVRKEVTSLKLALQETQEEGKGLLTVSAEPPIDSRGQQEHAMADMAAAKGEETGQTSEAIKPVRAKVQLPSAGASLAPRPDGKEIESFVISWAKNWESQDVKGYLAHYSKEFQPSRGLSLEAWRKQRKRRILKPASVQIVLDQIESQITGPSKARVTFEQNYRSDTYGDRVRKTLELQWEKGTWAIIREQSRAI